MAPRRKRPRRVLRAPVDPNRFAAGWRFVEPVAGFDVSAAPPGPPSLSVDITRGRDLVSLTIDFYDCELHTGGDGPAVTAIDGGTGRMVVRLAFQHLGERAVYETPAPIADETDPTQPPQTDPSVDPPGTLTPWPLDDDGAVPARASRLVFSIAAGESIPFSSDGILAAIGRLPMLVHPLATAKPAAAARPIVDPASVLVLPGGLAATLGATHV